MPPNQAVRSPLRPNEPIPEPPRAIGGALLLPDGAGPFPAVVIVHSTAGVDRRTAVYAQALRDAGIASLTVDLWGMRGIDPGMDLPRSRPASVLFTLPDVVGALRFLAAQPNIDRHSIGVMGGSWGAHTSIWLASDRVRKAYGGDGTWFRAFGAVYPSCWGYRPGGPAREHLEQGWPLGPLIVLAAGIEDFDSPSDGSVCRSTFGEGSTLPGRHLIRFHLYPDATHSWDTTSRALLSFYDPAAAGGRGGMVRTQRNEAATADAARRLRDFFAETLRAAAH
ncbi:MAG: dienelactone hydrolase family protein [Elioraea sp.]|nr:dienelactone hydrolase family protein [Elioraea sp.]